ncbi:MAG: dienelactone hydrolase family protein, partial [Candidatus Dormiibacterota bacterium]
MYEGILAESVSIQGDGGEWISAYLARPLGNGPFPGVLVIHHMPGWDESTKEITRTFAVHGYAAICPNLHHREGPDASPD